MNQAYSQLKRKLRKLNIHPYQWEDVYKILKRERIKLHLYPMANSLKGYYVNELRNVYRKRVICLNSNLSEFERLFVVLHELVHHFLHVTDSKRQVFNCHVAELNDSKQDVEADGLSLILAIPQSYLFELEETNFSELNPLLSEKAILRKTLFETFDRYLKEI